MDNWGLPSLSNFLHDTCLKGDIYLLGIDVFAKVTIVLYKFIVNPMNYAMFINSIVIASFVERTPRYNGWHASYIPSISTPMFSSFSVGISCGFMGGSLFALPPKNLGIF